MKSLLGIALLAGALATPAHTAGMLYKSVDANGTVIFSDTPPAGDLKVVEQRALPSYGSPAPSRAATAAGDPTAIINGDDAVARANEQVDMAEHALALARRNMWSPTDGVKLQPTRINTADLERVEFYKKNLRTARTYLAELVRDRQSQAVAAPIMVSANYVR